MAPSLGVLVPTRNSARLLPDHLRAMAQWVDLAQEIVCVDSHSTDGTPELLHERLPHPNVRWMTHPPGLYASWNAGLRALSTEYAYISTIGDTITRDGIQQLLRAATDLNADVVVSKPDFVGPNGERAEIQWPVDDIVRSLAITKPSALHRLEAAVFAAAHATQALTGSCASNLFRTAVLQRFPFPTEFGTGGDGIWSVMHAAEVTWAVVPDKFSTFLLHPTGASQAENPTKLGVSRPDAVLRQAVESWKKVGVVTADQLARIGWQDLERALSSYVSAKAVFDRCRKASWPWILNPVAWSARRSRVRSGRALRAYKERALRTIAALENASMAPGLSSSNSPASRE